MRYRRLSATGDYTFGQGRSNFFVNSSDGVAQLVGTRLRLLLGEWFLDNREGTPYSTKVLGTGTMATYDAAIRARVLQTRGLTPAGNVLVVTSIDRYVSAFDPNTRRLTVTMTISTIFGQTATTVVSPQVLP